MDLIDADHQMQIRDWLGGAGTDWENTEQGWSNPFGGGVQFSDQARSLADGAAAGRDVRAPILFTASLGTTSCDSEADAWELIEDLSTAWQPSGITDLTLYLQLPGLGLCWLVGRPRLVDVDVSLIRTGFVEAQVSFVGLDGVLHLEES